MSDNEDWIIKLDLDQDLSETEVEYGSLENIEWGSGVLKNGENEEMLCKCGKPAEQVIIGKEAYLARCHKCGFE